MNGADWKMREERHEIKAGNQPAVAGQVRKQRQKKERPVAGAGRRSLRESSPASPEEETLQRINLERITAAAASGLLLL